ALWLSLMFVPSLKPAFYIDNDNDFRDLMSQLGRQPVIGIDTEANSLHAYREQVCLIQISTRTDDYIIDPFAIDDIQPFGDVLANPKVEKIFHAVGYDLVCLKRDYGFDVVHVFDTMAAARVCGYTAVGLGNMLKQVFGVHLSKKHQRDNWAKRPLSASKLRYAQLDTHYLIPLRDHLYQELLQKGRLEEAYEFFEDVIAVGDIGPREFDPDDFWRLGIPNNLNRQQLAVLRSIFILRDKIARERNRPPFKILTNAALIEIAREMPSTRSQLHQVHGVSAMQVRRYGDALLQAIAEGRDQPLPRRPRHDPPDPVLAGRFSVLYDWRKQKARERGVDADVIISKQTLWALATELPRDMEELAQIEGLGPWRCRNYGAELLEIVARFSS
ncbi:MAG: ribonuclease D, partial [Chloroflexi bacterium]